MRRIGQWAAIALTCGCGSAGPLLLDSPFQTTILVRNESLDVIRVSTDVTTGRGVPVYPGEARCIHLTERFTALGYSSIAGRVQAAPDSYAGLAWTWQILGQNRDRDAIVPAVRHCR